MGLNVINYYNQQVDYSLSCRFKPGNLIQVNPLYADYFGVHLLNKPIQVFFEKGEIFGRVLGFDQNILIYKSGVFGHDFIEYYQFYFNRNIYEDIDVKLP